MIAIYADIPLSLKRKANKYFLGWIEMRILAVESSKEMLFDIFPEEMASTEPQKCKKILFQLYIWCKDDFIHELSPLHAYVFYNILGLCIELQDDEGEGVEIDDKEESDKNYIKRNVDKAEIYINFCFEDYDFLTIPYLFGHKYNNAKENLGELALGYEDYLKLLPSDIKKVLLTAIDSYKKSGKKDPKKKLNNCGLEKIVEEILNYLCFSIEQKRLSELLLQENKKPVSERNIHILIDNLISNYCKSYNLDLSHEAETGRGRIDFKFSRGATKVLLEIKKGSANLLRAIHHQLPTYLKANEIRNGYLLVFCYKESEIKKIQSLLLKSKNSNIKIVYVNLIKKKTAANL